jgi:DNA-binding response OmpR family regulator/Tfp pilus assembly protein PilF
LNISRRPLPDGSEETGLPPDTASFIRDFDFKTQRVLVIDDSSAMRKMLQMTVQSMGVQSVDLAESVFDVLFRIEKSGREYDIILCDYILGTGRDGQHLLEELKARKLLPYATVFIMVTAERGYEKVVNAVELAPDDYLLKPFTGQMLMDRIIEQVQKKKLLRTLYEHLDDERFDLAVVEANRLLNESPRYRMEISRVKADALIIIGGLDDAEAIYRSILRERSIPWARFGLARIEYMRHKLGAAEEILEKLLADAPRYTAACDLLADVKHDLEKHDGAQSVLEHGVKMSPRNLRRHRRLGVAALLNEDLETANASLSAVMEFGEHSVLIEPTDFSNLARCAVAMGDTERAMKVMDNGLRRLPENKRMRAASLFVKGLTAGATNIGESRQAVQTAIELLGEMRQEGELPDRDLALVGMESCLKAGMLEQASTLANALLDDQREASGEVHATTTAAVTQAFRSGGVTEAAEAIFERTRKEMAAINNEAVGLAKEGKLREAMMLFIRAAAGKSASSVAMLNAIHAILAVMGDEGWDENLARELGILFDRAKEKDSGNLKLAAYEKRRAELMDKHGIRSVGKTPNSLQTDDDILSAIGILGNTE